VNHPTEASIEGYGAFGGLDSCDDEAGILVGSGPVWRAGINRRGVVNERVTQERRSEPS
jgi:hypothetical protein